MTRDEALDILVLTPEDTEEEIEAAYRRLARRYPPEFRPEKFRRIDEAYRFLTSLPYRLEHFLNGAAPSSPSSSAGRHAVPRFDPTPPGEEDLEKALGQLRELTLLYSLWSPPEPG